MKSATGKRRTKLVSLSEAADMIKDGMTLGIGGFIFFNEPMALIRRIIRNSVKDLTIVSLGSSIDADLLIGAGCVKKIISTYVGFMNFAGIAPMFRMYMEKKLGLEYWACDFQHWHLALKASSYYAPYMLTKAGVGTDLPKINPDLEEVEVNGEKWIKVPPIYLDATIVHAQRADPYGNLQFYGPHFSERILIRATRGPVIAEVEEVVPTAVLNEKFPTEFSGKLSADYVVEVPYGAHPCESQGYYELDSEHIAEYIEMAESTRKGKDPEAFKKYLDKYVFKPATHEDYIEAIGGIKKLIKIRQKLI